MEFNKKRARPDILEEEKKDPLDDEPDFGCACWHIEMPTTSAMYTILVRIRIDWRLKALHRRLRPRQGFTGERLVSVICRCRQEAKRTRTRGSDNLVSGGLPGFKIAKGVPASCDASRQTLAPSLVHSLLFGKCLSPHLCALQISSARGVEDMSQQCTAENQCQHAEGTVGMGLRWKWKIHLILL